MLFKQKSKDSNRSIKDLTRCGCGRPVLRVKIEGASAKSITSKSTTTTTSTATKKNGTKFRLFRNSHHKSKKDHQQPTCTECLRCQNRSDDSSSSHSSNEHSNISEIQARGGLIPICSSLSKSTVSRKDQQHCCLTGGRGKVMAGDYDMTSDELASPNCTGFSSTRNYLGMNLNAEGFDGLSPTTTMKKKPSRFTFEGISLMPSLDDSLMAMTQSESDCSSSNILGGFQRMAVTDHHQTASLPSGLAVDELYVLAMNSNKNSSDGKLKSKGEAGTDRIRARSEDGEASIELIWEKLRSC